MRTIVSLFFICNCLYLYCQDKQELIDEYISNFQYSRALSYIEEQDMNKELLLKNALCYRGLDDYSKAVDILSALSEEYPLDIKIKSELALCYQALSNWQAGLNCYDNMIEMDSTNIYYKKQRADMLFRLGDFKSALSSYNYLTDNYGMKNMTKRSAQCYENMNMADSAIVYYKRAWEIDSTDSFSAASLINLNIKQAERKLPATVRYLSDAIRYSEEYIKKDSTNKQINLLNALSYYAANDYELAAERFERCNAAGDSSLVVNRSAGISYYSLGMNIMAYPYLLKAYEQDSTNNNVLYCLGVVSNELAEYKVAVKCFATLLRRTIPADITLYSYYKGLASGYEGTGENTLAVNNYRMAEQYATSGQNMYMYYNIASLYDYHLKQPELALEYYTKYKGSLMSYLEKLKNIPDLDNTDIAEIKSTESKITSLSSHMERLEKTIKKDTD